MFQIAKPSYNSIKQENKARLKNKYSWLSNKFAQPESRFSDTVCEPSNQTKVTIFGEALDSPVSDDQLKVLDKGPKFSLIPAFKKKNETELLTQVASIYFYYRA